MTLGALLAPPPSVLATMAVHGCDGVVCGCAHRAPAPAPAPPRAAGKSCHESVPVEPSCAMRAACRHDLPALASTPPFVMTAPVALGVDDHPDAVVSRPTTAAAPGHLRIEAPPPKTV